MRLKLFLFSLLSAGLLTAAWPPWGFAPLLFVAFIPLLYVQHIISGDNRLRAKHFFFYAFITFLIWNGLTTWWIWFASEGGAIMAIVTNALFMALVCLIFHKVKRALPERLGTFALIPLWIAYEFLHHDWDLSWPWLTLGNGLANVSTWIQWYEFTGAFGGSFWILIVNVLIFEIFIHRNTLLRPITLRFTYIISASIIFIFPIVYSLIRYHNFNLRDNTNQINVVVVQPNVNPYQKFTLDFREMTDKMLSLAQEKTDSTTDYIVFPETSLIEHIWENQIQYTWTVSRLRTFLKNYPKLKIVSGANTGYEYAKDEKHSPTARKFKTEDIYFEVYNTAIQIDSSQFIPVYHKSRLVPGVEKMPFPKILGFLEDFAIDLGGTSGSLGMQEERTVFVSANGPGKVAPVICYESIYGDYVGQYIRNGAEFIFIVTNDGWWGDTPGYKQHLLYARLRSIETRKSIARSANTGISCFIDQRGDFHQPQEWDKTSSIKQTIYSTNGMTFYTRHGDYIAWCMVWLSLTGIFYAIFRYFRRKFNAAKIQGSISRK